MGAAMAINRRLVSILRGDANGKPALECGDSRNGPAVQRFSLETVVFGDGQFPVVAEYETMAGIEQREGTIAPRIHGVDQVLKRRGHVDGFAECVAPLKLQTVRKALF